MTPFIAIIGTTGVGKTSLACALAEAANHVAAWSKGGACYLYHFF